MSVNMQNLVDAAFDWASGVVGDDVPVIWNRPSELRPKPPYVTLNFSNGPVRIGGQGEQIVQDDGGIKILSRYQATLTVMAFGKERFDAAQLANDLQSSLSNPVRLELLRKRNVAVFSEDPILDVSALLESGFEERRSMNVILGFCGEEDIPVAAVGVAPVIGSEVTETSIIEETELGGEVEGNDDITVQDDIINGP